MDLISFEKSGVNFIGLENLEQPISAAYQQLKTDKSLLNVYSKLDRASRTN